MLRAPRAIACFAVLGSLSWSWIEVERGQAQPAQPIPEALRPWQGWVLEDAPDHACALRDDAPLCEWPGRLVLDLDAHGGRFSQAVKVDHRALLGLPGAPGRWPSDVEVDGRAVPVVDRGGVPTIALEPGAYKLQGRYTWNALPERLELPAGTALIDLRIDGKAIAFPRRDEQGQLWLLSGGAGDPQGEQLSLIVSRKLEDGVPLIVTTRIKLRVSGRAREVGLGKVLLPGTQPLSIASDLPAQLEESGELRVQVRAGTYNVEVRARSEGSPAALGYHRAGPAWPESEVWVWQPDESLRQVELGGAPAVDPGRTELDRDWHGLPAFLLREGTQLELKTTRRGESSPPPNRLNLTRELWLDLDGSGYTVRDQLSAEMHQGYRLDLLAGDLGHVAADGEDLLITKAADGKHAGVELRKRQQQLLAEWRAEGRSTTLPAVGWSEDVQSLSAVLHLGPGYSLFAAGGVDSVSQSWLTDWDLFALFFVLLCAIAVLRLCGRGAFVLALITLVLCQQEGDAPQAVWVVLLASIALLRVLPRGFFRNLVRFGYGATVIGLLLVAVPFAVDQLRAALHPQLGATALGFTRPAPMAFGAVAGTSRQAEVEEASAVMLEEPAEPAPTAARHRDEEGAMDTAEQLARGGAVANQASVASSLGYAKAALQQDPEATLQTGPGVPTWGFRRWDLRWSGPVERTHQIELYLIPPALNRALSLLRVILLGLLIAVLIRCATPGRDKPGAAPGTSGPPAPEPGPAVAATLLLLAAGLFGAASPARADENPDQAMLDQLRARLTERPACHPLCASIDELALAVDARQLSLTLRVHAQAATSVALPGPAASWVPAGVTIDGRAEAPIVLREDGYLHVRVDPGVHEVQLRGVMPPTDSLTLAVLDRPLRARVTADGFKVDGVREDGQVEQALQISRLLKDERAEALATAALPPFLQLTRSLELGTSFVVHNRLERVSPTGTPIRVRVPLLPGEAVTESAFEVENGELTLSFGRDETVLEWSSRIAPRDRIVLSAAKGRPFSERWRIACGPIWHCEESGLAPIGGAPKQRHEAEFAPWPGEQLTLAITRPPAAAGQSVTIDSATLALTPGVRLRKAELTLAIRTSRGTSEALELPKGARVQAQTIDGAARPLRVEGSKLHFTLGPGAHHVNVQWQEPVGMSLVERAAPVVLHRPATNARLNIALPQDRWLLWASGPAWGPAILFWGYLLFALLAAAALARAAHSPLRFHEWALLGLGLTQVPAPAALCVVGWFFALAYRARMGESSRLVYNLTQLLLAGFTVIALGCLYGAVHTGLLMQPEMQVAGAGSSAYDLHWYVDRIERTLPTATVISAPLWVYRLIMLLWSLWLARSLVRWLPWAFRCFKQNGLWRKRAPRKAAAG